MYDIASSILQQKLAQVPGVGQVIVGGGRAAGRPGRREPDGPRTAPASASRTSAAVLAAANANRPKGEVASGRPRLVPRHDRPAPQGRRVPAARRRLPQRRGRALPDIASVTDSVEDIRTAGLANGKPAIILIIFRQPGANIIETVDGVRALLPQLQAAIPPTIKLSVLIDATRTIRASVQGRGDHAPASRSPSSSSSSSSSCGASARRSSRASPCPISLVGTFGVMYLLGYSIDNLSLMALTIATGFVVDDAIVVIENITRHLEDGMTPMEAAFRGAREIGFTVVSISISLVAVFIPILLMGGHRRPALPRVRGDALGGHRRLAGRLADGHADDVRAAAPPEGRAEAGAPRPARRARLRPDSGRLRAVARAGCCGTSALTLAVTLATMAATIYLYAKIPKGFFPQQDTGRLTGSIVARPGHLVPGDAGRS